MCVTHWDYEVLGKEVESGREAGLPVNIHFSQMWALPLETGTRSGVVSDNEDTEALAA